jgi:ribokinase
VVKIAVLASFNMDLVMRVERRPEAGETVQGDFAMHLGGKGFNQAVAARRLGAEVAVLGRVGDDAYGRQFLAALDDEGIDRRAVVVDPEAGTGVATIYVDPNGENTIVQSPRANRNVTREDMSAAYSLVAGSQFAMLNNETSMPAMLRFATLARGAGDKRMMYELADGGTPTMLNPAPAGFVWDDILQTTDVIVANEIEARVIIGSDHPGYTSVESLCAIGPRKAVVTLGADGSIGGNRIEALSCPAFAVNVVDTTGAGDAFCGALAVRLAEGADLADAMRFANAAGALACTKHGAYPSMPYRADVEALLREQGASR